MRKQDSLSSTWRETTVQAASLAEAQLCLLLPPPSRAGAPTLVRASRVYSRQLQYLQLRRPPPPEGLLGLRSRRCPCNTLFLALTRHCLPGAGSLVYPCHLPTRRKLPPERGSRCPFSCFWGLAERRTHGRVGRCLTGRRSPPARLPLHFPFWFYTQRLLAHLGRHTPRADRHSLLAAIHTETATVRDHGALRVRCRTA